MPAPQLQGKPLGAIGAAGQNTQLSDIDLPPAFGTVVVNGYLNESGKVTARKSFDRVTSDNSDLVTTNPIQRVYRHITATGTSVLMCAGNGRIFNSDGATLTSQSSGHTTNNWQFASLNGQIFACQVGKSLYSFADDGTTVAAVADPATPIAIHAAFGRLWALSSDGLTLEWSDILDGDDFAAGDSGSLDLDKLHQSTRAPGIAIVSFNRQIVVLCTNQILVLGLPEDLNPNGVSALHATDPSMYTTPIFLRDVIPNIGCVARDSVVVAGDDVLFLSEDGVRSLARSMAEKQGPSPMTELSALNKNALVRNMETETLANVSACWHPGESWYQLFLPTTQEIWLFDMSSKVDGTPTPKTFIWRTGATRPIYCGTWFSDEKMYYGCVGGLARNNLYDADDDYDLVVTSGWMSLGAPDSLKHFKKLILSLTGGGGQDATVKWYVDFDDNNVRTRTFTLETAADPDEYNVGEYNVAEFSSGLGTAAFGIHLSNSAQFIKLEITLPVSAALVTINNAQMLYQLGRVRG
jgi:hypothetical protein